MRTEEWFEKAEAYFSNTMNEKEIKLFEEETAQSEELSELMQLWKTTDEEAALYENSEEEAAALIATHQRLKRDFIGEQTVHGSSTVPGKNVKQPLKIKFFVWQWVAVAAVISGIILGIELLIPVLDKKTPPTQTSTRQDKPDTVLKDSANIRINKNTEDIVNTQEQTQAAILYAEVFVPDKIPDNPNGPLDDAFFYYASAQYKNAVTAIDNARDKAPTRGNTAFTSLTDFYAYYYKALSLMSLDNVEEAIPLLNHALEQSPAETLKVKAQWYLSLAYLKQEKIPVAVETLQLVIHSPVAGTYKSKAEKLLAKLNSQ